MQEFQLYDVFSEKHERFIKVFFIRYDLEFFREKNSVTFRPRNRLQNVQVSTGAGLSIGEPERGAIESPLERRLDCG